MAETLLTFIDETALLDHVARSYEPDDVFDQADLLDWAETQGLLGDGSLMDAWADATSTECADLVLEWLVDNGVPEELGLPVVDAEYIHDHEHHGGAIRYRANPLCRTWNGRA